MAYLKRAYLNFIVFWCKNFVDAKNWQSAQDECSRLTQLIKIVGKIYAQGRQHPLVHIGALDALLHGVTPPGAVAPPLSSDSLQPGLENVAIYLVSQFLVDKIHQCSIWLFLLWLADCWSEWKYVNYSVSIYIVLGKWQELWRKLYIVETLAKLDCWVKRP